MRFVVDSPDILIFDIEVRPTAWIGGDFVGRSLTAAAWSWLDEDRVEVRTITRQSTDTLDVLIPIAGSLEACDLAVGHFIRGFDLGNLNGELERYGMESLPAITTADTKLDRYKTMGLSQSLENLIARYGLESDKFRMAEPMWEEFNLWQTPRSVEWVRERVVSDVAATKELFVALRDAGRLNDTKTWSPAQGKAPRYSV